MRSEYLSYKQTGNFSTLMTDYLDRKPELDRFIAYKHSLDGYSEIIRKRQNFKTDRELLVKRLREQNGVISLTVSSFDNIDKLRSEKTFAVTTGHQLNLFTGPLYYIYKTASVIKLSRELKEKFPDYDFVPVFWMASEDHDFREVNYFNYKSGKLVWESNQTGAVGRMHLDWINNVLDEFTDLLDDSENAAYLKSLFKRAYLGSANFADATRYLVNELFGDHGIVIIDGDDADLKREMIPYFKRELSEFVSDNNLKDTNVKLEESGYKIQVTQRRINLFYLKDNIRERIVFDREKYHVLNTSIEFTEEEIMTELENYPERFSPNSILRPLYQEMVLPNIAYVGGGGELAYWFQLKTNFEDFGVSFPVLVLRNSVSVVTERYKNFLDKLKLDRKDLFFYTKDELIRKKVLEKHSDNILLDRQKEETSGIFEDLKLLHKYDTSLLGAIRAQEAKQLKGLESLEKKIFREYKRRESDTVNSIELLYEWFFPHRKLQERVLNFSEIYLEYGESFIGELIKNISVLENEYTILG